MTALKSIAVAISGGGSNMMAIHRAILLGKISATIKLVVTDNENAAGLDYARQHNLKILHLPYQTVEFSESLLLNAIDDGYIDLLCLAGFLKILSKNFIDNCTCPIINIHPSLLPRYKGLKTHERALHHSDKFHGCTVHYVTDQLDSGGILGQRKIEITPDLRNKKALQQAVLKQEHILYPQIIANLVKGL